jgi:Fe2+ or Zn2+ uptake regulation protein
MQNDEACIARVGDAILHYLQRNPNATDTVKGIVNWWLPTQDHISNEQAVEQALDELVARGLVKKTVLVDGTALYAGTARPEDE